MSSALVVRTPALGVSGNGLPNSSLTPATTAVSPMRTRAEPSAVSTNPGSMTTFRVLVRTASVQALSRRREVQDMGRADLGRDLVPHWPPGAKRAVV